MPKLFLVVLAVAWIVVLVPPVLRARSESRNRGDSIGDFQNRLGVLSRSHSPRQFRRAPRASRATKGNISPMPGAASALGAHRATASAVASGRVAKRPVRPSMHVPLPDPMGAPRNPAAERSARRRREVVTGLFAATTLSAATASALGGTFVWGLQILTDLALLTYVAGMLWFRGAGANRSRNVSYLPQVRPRPAPAYALRRTASS